jgi:hypothetical protein
MRAWETLCMGVASVVLATTRAQARVATWRAACAAGDELLFVAPILVRRAPHNDDLVAICLGLNSRRPQILSMDYVFRLRGGTP